MKKDFLFYVPVTAAAVTLLVVGFFALKSWPFRELALLAGYTFINALISMSLAALIKRFCNRRRE